MDDFDEYVVAAWPRLLRSAWLLTGDWHKAEDLVQTVLTRVYPRWARVRDENPDAYLRAMMTTTFLTWWRRKWRGETAWERPPEVAVPDMLEHGSAHLTVSGAGQAAAEAAGRGDVAIPCRPDRGPDSAGARHLRWHGQIPYRKGSGHTA